MNFSFHRTQFIIFPLLFCLLLNFGCSYLVKIGWFNDEIHDLELQKPEEVAALILESRAKSRMDG